MPRILPASCSAIAALFFVSVQAVAALSGPIKATKTICAFPVPPGDPNSLAVAGDGNVYGAASQGYLVRVTPNGAFSIIHDFHGEGAMLAMARVAGETAPLLLTTFLSQSINPNPFTGAQASIPTFVWDQINSGTNASIARAWSGALTLILLVMALNLVARLIARHNRVT